MKKEKVYCKDCRYCGEPVYHPCSPELMQQRWPLFTMKEVHGHGIEIELRFCGNPDVPNSEEVDTFFMHVKNNFTPRCHEVNKNNSCKYFKKKLEVIDG